MHEDVKWLFGLVIVFGLVWFVAGSYNSTTSKQPFIKPLVENSNQSGPAVMHVSPNLPSANWGGSVSSGGSVSGNSSNANTSGNQNQIAQELKNAGIQSDQIDNELATLGQAGATSPLAGKISIVKVSQAGLTVGNEYIELQASRNNTSPIQITGLRFESVASGRGVTIPKGATLPFQNQVSVEQPIYLSPGDIAYITSGRSPLGISFKLNECTGYYNQFQKFTPALPSRCPLPKNEPLPSPTNRFNDQCLNYINTLKGCQIIITPPANISPECQTYVTTEINYTKCVEKHKSDANFYSPEWRVYLNYGDALWKSKRELIHLLDTNGKIIDAVTY